MKITFLLPYASTAGGVRVVATYATRLQARGHEVHVISQPARPARSTPAQAYFALRRQARIALGRPVLSPPGPPTTLLAPLGRRHMVLDRPGPPDPGAVPDADIVVATWWKTAEWVADLPPEKGAKAYLIQDLEAFDERDPARIEATYALPLAPLAVSGYIRDGVVAASGRGDVIPVTNGIDTAHFDAPPRDRGDPPTVGFLYTRKARKRADLAIAAIEAARTRLPGLRARVFAAKPPDDKLPLPDWAEVEVAPPEARIPAIYAACDLWLFTSESEGFGLPVLEAMACRTPVLATRAGAAPDLIDGTNGTLLPPDPDAFADEIARLATAPPETWRAMSEAARATARAHDWDRATDRFLEVLQQVVAP